jgi:hypothetical protein
MVGVWWCTSLDDGCLVHFVTDIVVPSMLVHAYAK